MRGLPAPRAGRLPVAGAMVVGFSATLVGTIAATGAMAGLGTFLATGASYPAQVVIVPLSVFGTLAMIALLPRFIVAPVVVGLLDDAEVEGFARAARERSWESARWPFFAGVGFGALGALSILMFPPTGIRTFGGPLLVPSVLGVGISALAYLVVSTTGAVSGYQESRVYRRRPAVAGQVFH